jgi:putative superfamily III holin-X
MAKLKKNLNNITDDTKVLVEDYLRLFSGKVSEKLALFLGILASIFVLFTLIMVLVIFSSFALAGYLNKVLPGEYWGFGIVSGIYLLTIVFFIVKIFRTKTPLFSNLFVKLIVTVMNIDLDQSGSIKGLKKEHERVQHKIDADKTKIEADFQILKHGLIGNLLKEFLAVFTSKKRGPEVDSTKREDSEKEDGPPKKDGTEKEDNPEKEEDPEKEEEST